jgi:AcrR family transcriptional regulator
VPRTRADVERGAKVDEIVAAARDRLVEGGFGALSVAELARHLGLAQNAIYWYFPTKDHLFVAAVERILHDVLDRKPRQGATVDRVLWFAERLAAFQELRITMRERARTSEVVAGFERDVVGLFRVLLAGALREDVDADRLDDTADAVMALCEGVLLREMSRAQRARLIRYGFERLT